MTDSQVINRLNQVIASAPGSSWWLDSRSGGKISEKTFHNRYWLRLHQPRLSPISGGVGQGVDLGRLRMLYSSDLIEINGAGQTSAKAVSAPDYICVEHQPQATGGHWKVIWSDSRHPVCLVRLNRPRDRQQPYRPTRPVILGPGVQCTGWVSGREGTSVVTSWCLLMPISITQNLRHVTVRLVASAETDKATENQRQRSLQPLEGSDSDENDLELNWSLPSTNHHRDKDRHQTVSATISGVNQSGASRSETHKPPTPAPQRGTDPLHLLFFEANSRLIVVKRFSSTMLSSERLQYDGALTPVNLPSAQATLNSVSPPSSSLSLDFPVSNDDTGQTCQDQVQFYKYIKTADGKPVYRNGAFMSPQHWDNGSGRGGDECVNHNGGHPGLSPGDQSDGFQGQINGIDYTNQADMPYESQLYTLNQLEIIQGDDSTPPPWISRLRQQKVWQNHSDCSWSTIRQASMSSLPIGDNSTSELNQGSLADKGWTSSSTTSDSHSDDISLPMGITRPYSKNGRLIIEVLSELNALTRILFEHKVFSDAVQGDEGKASFELHQSNVAGHCKQILARLSTLCRDGEDEDPEEVKLSTEGRLSNEQRKPADSTSRAQPQLTFLSNTASGIFVPIPVACRISSPARLLVGYFECLSGLANLEVYQFKTNTIGSVNWSVADEASVSVLHILKDFLDERFSGPSTDLHLKLQQCRLGLEVLPRLKMVYLTAAAYDLAPTTKERRRAVVKHGLHLVNSCLEDYRFWFQELVSEDLSNSLSRNNRVAPASLDQQQCVDQYLSKFNQLIKQIGEARRYDVGDGASANTSLPTCVHSVHRGSEECRQLTKFAVQFTEALSIYLKNMSFTSPEAPRTEKNPLDVLSPTTLSPHGLMSSIQQDLDYWQNESSMLKVECSRLTLLNEIFTDHRRSSLETGSCPSGGDQSELQLLCDRLIELKRTALEHCSILDFANRMVTMPKGFISLLAEMTAIHQEIDSCDMKRANQLASIDLSLRRLQHQLCSELAFMTQMCRDLALRTSTTPCLFTDADWLFEWTDRVKKTYASLASRWSSKLTEARSVRLSEALQAWTSQVAGKLKMVEDQVPYALPHDPCLASLWSLLCEADVFLESRWRLRLEAAAKADEQYGVDAHFPAFLETYESLRCKIDSFLTMCHRHPEDFLVDLLSELNCGLGDPEVGTTLEEVYPWADQTIDVLRGCVSRIHRYLGTCYRRIRLLQRSINVASSTGYSTGPEAQRIISQWVISMTDNQSWLLKVITALENVVRAAELVDIDRFPLRTLDETYVELFQARQLLLRRNQAFSEALQYAQEVLLAELPVLHTGLTVLGSQANRDEVNLRQRDLLSEDLGRLQEIYADLMACPSIQATIGATEWPSLDRFSAVLQSKMNYARYVYSWSDRVTRLSWILDTCPRLHSTEVEEFSVPGSTYPCPEGSGESTWNSTGWKACRGLLENAANSWKQWVEEPDQHHAPLHTGDFSWTPMLFENEVILQCEKTVKNEQLSSISQEFSQLVSQVAQSMDDHLAKPSPDSAEREGDRLDGTSTSTSPLTDDAENTCAFCCPDVWIDRICQSLKSSDLTVTGDVTAYQNLLSLLLKASTSGDQTSPKRASEYQKTWATCYALVLQRWRETLTVVRQKCDGTETLSQLENLLTSLSGRWWDTVSLHQGVIANQDSGLHQLVGLREISAVTQAHLILMATGKRILDECRPSRHPDVIRDLVDGQVNACTSLLEMMPQPWTSALCTQCLALKTQALSIKLHQAEQGEKTLSLLSLFNGESFVKYALSVVDFLLFASTTRGDEDRVRKNSGGPSSTMERFRLALHQQLSGNTSVNETVQNLHEQLIQSLGGKHDEAPSFAGLLHLEDSLTRASSLQNHLHRMSLSQQPMNLLSLRSFDLQTNHLSPANHSLLCQSTLYLLQKLVTDTHRRLTASLVAMPRQIHATWSKVEGMRQSLAKLITHVLLSNAQAEGRYQDQSVILPRDLHVDTPNHNELMQLSTLVTSLHDNCDEMTKHLPKMYSKIADIVTREFDTQHYPLAVANGLENALTSVQASLKQVTNCVVKSETTSARLELLVSEAEEFTHLLTNINEHVQTVQRVERQLYTSLPSLSVQYIDELTMAVGEIETVTNNTGSHLNNVGMNESEEVALAIKFAGQRLMELEVCLEHSAEAIRILLSIGGVPCHSSPPGDLQEKESRHEDSVIGGQVNWGWSRLTRLGDRLGRIQAGLPALPLTKSDQPDAIQITSLMERPTDQASLTNWLSKTVSNQETTDYQQSSLNTNTNTNSRRSGGGGDAQTARRKQWNLRDVLGSHSCVYPECKRMREEWTSAVPTATSGEQRNMLERLRHLYIDVVHFNARLRKSWIEQRSASTLHFLSSRQQGGDAEVLSPTGRLSPNPQEILSVCQRQWHANTKLREEYQALLRGINEVRQLQLPQVEKLVQKCESLKVLWGDELEEGLLLGDNHLPVEGGSIQLLSAFKRSDSDEPEDGGRSDNELEEGLPLGDNHLPVEGGSIQLLSAFKRSDSDEPEEDCQSDNELEEGLPLGDNHLPVEGGSIQLLSAFKRSDSDEPEEDCQSDNELEEGLPLGDNHLPVEGGSIQLLSAFKRSDSDEPEEGCQSDIESPRITTTSNYTAFVTNPMEYKLEKSKVHQSGMLSLEATNIDYKIPSPIGTSTPWPKTNEPGRNSPQLATSTVRTVSEQNGCEGDSPEPTTQLPMYAGEALDLAKTLGVERKLRKKAKNGKKSGGKSANEGDRGMVEMDEQREDYLQGTVESPEVPETDQPSPKLTTVSGSLYDTADSFQAHASKPDGHEEILVSTSVHLANIGVLTESISEGHKLETVASDCKELGINNHGMNGDWNSHSFSDNFKNRLTDKLNGDVTGFSKTMCQTNGLDTTSDVGWISSEADWTTRRSRRDKFEDTALNSFTDYACHQAVLSHGIPVSNTSLPGDKWPLKTFSKQVGNQNDTPDVYTANQSPTSNVHQSPTANEPASHIVTSDVCWIDVQTKNTNRKAKKRKRQSNKQISPFQYEHSSIVPNGHNLDQSLEIHPLVDTVVEYVSSSSLGPKHNNTSSSRVTNQSALMEDTILCGDWSTFDSRLEAEMYSPPVVLLPSPIPSVSTVGLQPAMVNGRCGLNPDPPLPPVDNHLGDLITRPVSLARPQLIGKSPDLMDMSQQVGGGKEEGTEVDNLLNSSANFSESGLPKEAEKVNATKDNSMSSTSHSRTHSHLDEFTVSISSAEPCCATTYSVNGDHTKKALDQVGERVYADDWTLKYSPLPALSDDEKDTRSFLVSPESRQTVYCSLMVRQPQNYLSSCVITPGLDKTQATVYYHNGPTMHTLENTGIHSTNSELHGVFESSPPMSASGINDRRFHDTIDTGVQYSISDISGIQEYLNLRESPNHLTDSRLRCRRHLIWCSDEAEQLALGSRVWTCSRETQTTEVNTSEAFHSPELSKVNLVAEEALAEGNSLASSDFKSPTASSTTNNRGNRRRSLLPILFLFCFILFPLVLLPFCLFILPTCPPRFFLWTGCREVRFPISLFRLFPAQETPL